jgi:hypothetical protein
MNHWHTLVYIDTNTSTSSTISSVTPEYGEPFRFIAELLTLGESQVSIMTTISKESKETVPNSSSILLTNDLELDRNKEGKKVYEALLPNLIFRRLLQLLRMPEL